MNIYIFQITKQCHKLLYFSFTWLNALRFILLSTFEPSASIHLILYLAPVQPSLSLSGVSREEYTLIGFN